MKKIHLWYHIQKCICVSFVSLYGLIVPEQFDFLNEQTVPEYAQCDFISTNSAKIYVPSRQKQAPVAYGIQNPNCGRGCIICGRSTLRSKELHCKERIDRLYGR